MSWAICDIQNAYVSCERLFDASLRLHPVVVLSNGDGCVVARSEEARALHIKVGAPVFKISETIRRHGVQLRSSNYEMYADVNRRFNPVLAEHTDTLEVYSIDESFFRLPTLPNGLGDVASAHRARAAFLRSVGLPTRMGLGPTRTLSKVANALAKASEKVWGGVYRSARCRAAPKDACNMACQRGLGGSRCARGPTAVAGSADRRRSGRSAGDGCARRRNGRP